MKCYVELNNDFVIENYCDYLKDVIHTSFKLINKIDSFYVLQSENNILCDFLLIRGENINTLKLLSKLPVVEKNIILITCTASFVISTATLTNNTLTDNINIFQPKAKYGNKSFIPCIDKKCIDFKFSPCDSEYNMYLNKNIYNIKQLIKMNFEKSTILQCKRKEKKWLTNLKPIGVKN